MSMFSRFRSNERGNVAILFGLAVMPAVMAMGLAVDYARVSNARTEMQAAVDAAAIAAATKASQLSQKEFEDYAQYMFDINLAKPTFAVNDFVVERGERTVTARADGKMPTSLMAIIPGFDTLDVKAEATVGWKSSKIEVAMVLDTTGSMKGSKIVEMRKAARSLVDILSSNSYTADAARIAVVPFNSQVRIDTKDRNASWLYTELDDPAYRNRPQYQSGAYEATTRSSWQGCISNRERNGDYDVTLKAPRTNELRQTGHWATKCDGNPAKITPLSNNFRLLKSDIASLPAVGSTNITLGVAWGMMALSDTGVFATGASKSDEIQKFMIVLTDGNNTVDRVTEFGQDLNKPAVAARVKAMNARTALACDAAKSGDIKIYTIRVMDGDASLLRNCASDESKFYNVQNASQLDSVFRSIAQEIAQLRLTH